MDQFNIDNSYPIIREIGKGGTGTVFLAYHTRLEKYVVLKRLKQSVPQQFLRHEVDILKKLHHSNLPQVYDYIQTPNGVYSVMDYIEGRTLAEYISAGVRPSQREVSLWLWEMAYALQYLHGQSTPIFHCDIKPENIIITPEGHAILIDFGVSLVGYHDRLTGISPVYASPEQVRLAGELVSQQTPDVTLDGRTDLYSLGATFFHLMSGRSPTPNRGGAPLTDLGLPYSEAITQLIDSMLEEDRENRPADARRVRRLLDRQELRDRRYRLLLICQIGSIVLSGLLLGLGVYFLIWGGAQRQTEQFTAVMEQLQRATEENNAPRAKALGETLLAEMAYQKQLNARPEDRARVLALLGDLAFAEGRYAYAASYYRRAMEVSEEQKSLYFRSELIALARDGSVAEAQERMNLYGAALLTPEDYLLSSATLAARTGDHARCLRDVERLLAQTEDRELRAQAALTAASAVTSVAERIGWLEQAASASDSRNVLRELVAAYAELGLSGDEPEMLARALDGYRRLLDTPYPAKNDRINYAILLRAKGEADRALQWLKAIELDYPDDSGALTYMAFLYHELGDSSSAAVYCRKALQAWRNGLNTDDELYQQLVVLAERYGL